MSSSDTKQSLASTRLRMTALVSAIAIILVITAPIYMSLRAEAQLPDINKRPSENLTPDQSRYLACGYNLKTIRNCLEMYKTDHKGKYPDKLSKLTEGKYGGYTGSMGIPTCPVTRKDTYSASYKVSPDGKNFTVYCSGHNHKALGVPPNRPAYDSRKGIIPR
ncbi:hypothetical protein IJT17_05845 [bacterium]|nr:hypothetical protein [bacterium]